MKVTTSVVALGTFEVNGQVEFRVIRASKHDLRCCDFTSSYPDKLALAHRTLLWEKYDGNDVQVFVDNHEDIMIREDAECYAKELAKNPEIWGKDQWVIVEERRYQPPWPPMTVREAAEYIHRYWDDNLFRKNENQLHREQILEEEKPTQ